MRYQQIGTIPYRRGTWLRKLKPSIHTYKGNAGMGIWVWHRNPSNRTVGLFIVIGIGNRSVHIDWLWSYQLEQFDA